MTDVIQGVGEKWQAAVDMASSGEFIPERLSTPAGDSFRPADLTTTGGVAYNPPKCPRCETYLYPMSSNPVGDVDFQCLNAAGMDICGYETIYRVATRAWEQHPNKPVDARWVPPGRVHNRQPVESHAQSAPKDTSAETPEGLLTIRAAAERLGCDTHALAALIAEGKLPVVKREGKTFVTAETIGTMQRGL